MGEGGSDGASAHYYKLWKIDLPHLSKSSVIWPPDFRSLLHGIIELSRAYPTIHPGTLLPSLSVHAVLRMLLERAANLFHMLLTVFTNTYVCIHIDSAIITDSSYLAVLLRSCESESSILPIQLLAVPSKRAGFAETLFRLYMLRHVTFAASLFRKSNAVTHSDATVASVRSDAD